MSLRRNFIARREAPKQSNRSDCFAPAVLATIVGWLIFTTICNAESPLFQQANDQYKEGSFKQALETYQKLLQTGQVTAAVYYNMGNAALKAGDKGHAVVYYERARKAAPRDADLLWNLEILRDALKDKVEDRSFFVLAGLRSFAERWSATELGYFFTTWLALAALLSILGFFFPAWRTRGAWLPLFGMLALSGALFGWKVWDSKDPRAVVLDKETAAYYGPSERETKALTLHEGAEGRILDESGEWLYISLQNKNAGWIRKNSCEII